MSWLSLIFILILTITSIALSAPSGNNHLGTVSSRAPLSGTGPTDFGASSVSSRSITATSSTASSSLSQCFGLPAYSIKKISELKIALVKPIFTSTAYSDAFYNFYTKYGTVPKNQNVTSDLNSLNATLVDRWGLSRPLFDFLSSPQATRCGVTPGKNLQILSDVNVTQGALFSSNGSRRFDAVVLGFSEYVSLQEYLAFKGFVADGGTIVLMSAANFIAQVRYYPSSNHLALVAGHGWRFNGKSAWRYSPYEYWRSDNANWVGSDFCCFEPAYSQERASTIYAVANTSNPISVALREKFGGRVFGLYHPHEESAVANGTDSIIARFPSFRGHLVAAYAHAYKAGHVVNIGVFGTDIISSDRTSQYFLILGLLYG